MYRKKIYKEKVLEKHNGTSGNRYRKRLRETYTERDLKKHTIKRRADKDKYFSQTEM